MGFAETLSDARRKRARLQAYAACCFGCISEVMLDSSAIIILFLSMNGGSATLTMLSTGFSGIMAMFLLIPCAGLVERMTPRRSIKYASLTGIAGYLLMAAAPLFGPAIAPYAVLSGCFIFSVQRPLYGAAWYPLLDHFLLPRERGSFFGTLRTTYMFLSGTLFFLIGLVMGKEPPMWLMQTVIAVTGLLIFGRWFFISLFPMPDNPPKKSLDLLGTLKISIKNSSLVGWSVYTCLLNVAFTSVLPLSLIYLKEYVQLGANTIQILSTVGIAGSILAFFCFSTLLRKLRLRRFELLIHLMCVVLPLAFFLIPCDTPFFPWIAGGLLFALYFVSSSYMCISSVEMMALARPGNKTMAMAFCQSYQNVGISTGRIGTSLVLSFSLLTPQWTKFGLTFSHYQSLFLGYSVLAALILVMLPLLPSFIPSHEDYYEPEN